MPYLDRWGLTATKVSAGVFTVTDPVTGSSVTVQADQVLGTDALNAAAALFRAIQQLYPGMPSPWDLRYEYAIARWKLDAYQNLASAVSGQTRTALNEKRSVWITEESRLKALMGSDAV